MLSSTVTAPTGVATFSVHLQHTNAPGYSRNYDHGPAPARACVRPDVFQFLTKPVQPASSKDFHLDTFFSPAWMSGPHVFSFAKDGTVVHPETYSAEPYPGYRARAFSSGRNVGDIASPSPSPPSAPISKASGRMNKGWKNVAISEQDDAEFAAREVEAKMRAQVEAKSKLMGLVYRWPPMPLPTVCAACSVLAVPRQRAGMSLSVGAHTHIGTQESVVPALSYGSSGESESESEVLRVVPVLSGARDTAHRKGVPLEENVWKSQRKASTPLLATRMEEGESESGWTRFGMPRW